MIIQISDNLLQICLLLTHTPKWHSHISDSRKVVVFEKFISDNISLSKCEFDHKSILNNVLERLQSLEAVTFSNSTTRILFWEVYSNKNHPDVVITTKYSPNWSCFQILLDTHTLAGKAVSNWKCTSRRSDLTMLMATRNFSPEIYPVMLYLVQFVGLAVSIYVLISMFSMLQQQCRDQNYQLRRKFG